MKKKIFILIFPFVFFSCVNNKIKITESLIRSFGIAVRENDNELTYKLFPNLKFIVEYPKIDKTEILKINISGDYAYATCSLFYQSELGKKYEYEVEYLVDLKNQVIQDVKGFLLHKNRSELIKSDFFTYFPDLAVHESDYDMSLLIKYAAATNRKIGYEFYAKKIINENTVKEIKVKEKGNNSRFIESYGNVKIEIKITNDNKNEVKYLIAEKNLEHIMANKTPIGDKTYVWLMSGETKIIERVYVGEFFNKYSKEKLLITPVITNLHDAIRIVKNYKDSSIEDEILNGSVDYRELDQEFSL